MAIKLKGRSLCSMRELACEEILGILDLADRLKADRQRVFAESPMRGRTLAMVFQKPSLRTRVSFETGMTRMGGHAIYLAPTDIKLGQRETTEDIALVLSRYADIIMARVFGHDIVVELARHATVPVINGLSDFEHPCQILADFQTVRERRGRLDGLRGAFIGDGNNVANSLMFAAARVGMHFAVASPDGYKPAEAVLREARELARETGAEIRVVTDPVEAARGADVLYTDVWASMGQESEAAERREKFRAYQINRALMQHASADCVLLHCLPAHYGEEIEYEAARTPNSAIFDEAENRMHAQNALMVLLLGEEARFAARKAVAKPALGRKAAVKPSAGRKVAAKPSAGRRRPLRRSAARRRRA